MRACHDAVLVGGGTARADDPALTVRGMGPVPQPVRVVAARSLDMPADGQLVRTIGEAPLWLVFDPEAAGSAAKAVWADRGARLVPVTTSSDGRLDPAAMMAALATEGLTRVFCEGGGTLAAALLAADLVDEIAVFSAGLALGSGGRPGVGPLALRHLADATRFRLMSAETVGGDVLHRWSRT
jgi:diaminohydroxyphosphoribosylaminopyrimidine deaminase/5-amino-6-(5-phosphoribosylamino)uracil reductase